MSVQRLVHRILEPVLAPALALNSRASSKLPEGGGCQTDKSSTKKY